MARNLVKGLLCAFSLAAASASLHVDESATKIILKENQSAVSLAVRNPSSGTVPAQVTLRWLNASGVAVSVVDQSLNVPPGDSDAVIVFPLPANSAGDGVWYRLKYQIRAEGNEASGTLALAEVAKYLFELRCSAPHRARPRQTFQVQVSALHPASRKPVSGISVEGTLDVEGNPLVSGGITNESGVTTLEFQSHAA